MLFSIAKFLVLPPACFFLLLLLALLMGRWKRRLGRACLWGLLIVVYLSTTPFVAGELMAPLQPYAAVDPRQPADGIGAVVVLGAGVYAWAPEYPLAEASNALGFSVGPLTLQRLQYASFLARAIGQPLLVSGGPSGAAPDITVAEAMRLSLQRDFGIEPAWIEVESRSTLSNAQRSAALLQAAGIRKFYLVTHAWHMPRAMVAFEGLDVEAVPAPTRFISRSEMTWRDFLPSAAAFSVTYYATHEWLGLTWYRLQA